MPIIIAFISGILFGLGLVLAGMGNPAKILAFLDVTGKWDPSLLVTMAGSQESHLMVNSVDIK